MEQLAGYGEEAHELIAEIAVRLEEGEPVDWDALARAHPELAEELARLRAGWGRVETLLDRFGMDGSGPAWANDAAASAAREVLAGLERRRGAEPRLRVEGELAHGGMARVLRAFDLDLRRPVAMKVCGEADEPLPFGGSTGLVHRFVDEAQITGQLTHPGVVPVHELGVDDQGRPFFTMELVEGRTLSEIVGLARRGEQGWTPRRVLEVVLKVCDALAYAHSRGVIHRDLKPANVMVGRFGEVRVMDWGLATVVGSASGGSLTTLRGEARAGENGSGVLTATGDVVGTPAYMPPEQAEGRVDELDARADVYALGAILYELLSGQAPYRGEHSSRDDVLARVIEGPPGPLAREGFDAPVELYSICDKAMARAPVDRYPDMGAVAEDLRRCLEGRVVLAHGAGLGMALRKWVARNRALAAGIGLALAGLLIGGLLWFQGERRRLAELEDLATLAEVEHLQARAARLWPAWPAQVPELERWLQDAETLASRGPALEGELAALRARADGLANELDAWPHPRAAELEGLRLQLEVLEAGYHGLSADAAVTGAEEGASAEEERARLVRAIAGLEVEIETERALVFQAPSDQVRHDTLARLVAEMRRLLGPDPDHGTIASVRRRHAQASSLEARSIGAAAEAWREAIEAIADPIAHPAYRGLTLAPQTGLVPLGRDPHSGLWEFVDVQTGSVPERGPDGALANGIESGVVFVLIPGGIATVGAPYPKDAGPGVPFYDPDALPPRECPTIEVELDPFFLAKHELTQAQWTRWTGSNPSHYEVGFRQSNGFLLTWLCPVENVSWEQAAGVMRELGCALPSEAQWEYAARAGTTTVRWTGDSLASLAGAENVRDKTGIRYADDRVENEEREFPFDDGFVTLAPIGSFRPNPFGLHDMLGNVREYCADLFFRDARWPRRAGDGLLRAPEDQGERSVRGGYYGSAPASVRSAFRLTQPTELRSYGIGVRPARAIER